jgi:hypothetical protein
MGLGVVGCVVGGMMGCMVGRMMGCGMGIWMAICRLGMMIGGLGVVNRGGGVVAEYSPSIR